MRTLVAVSLLVASLAGCAEPTLLPVESQGEPAVGSQPDLEPEPEQNVTANTPPVAMLNATANGTALGTTINGTLPLNVTFGLDGSDADGDNLTWVLTLVPIGNETNATVLANGTELPATVAYNFTEAGNFSVVLTVSDGNATIVRQLVVAVAADGAMVQVPPPVVLRGTLLVPLMDTSATNCSPSLTDYIDFPSEYWGWRYQARSGWVAEWWTGSGTHHGASNSGTVPQGSDNVGSCPALGTVTNVSSWTITLTHPDWVG